jgi:hypothetical protein
MSNTIQFGERSGATGLVGAVVESYPDSYKLSDYGPERRRHERNRVRYRAEARRMDNTLEAIRTPKFALTVLDISEGGIRATSRMPVVDGERLAIFLPPEAGMPERIFGKVIRCSPRRDGWGLAIKFDYIPAA